MTEDEAKTSVCCGPPIVAMAVIQTGAATRGEKTEGHPFCRGAACMAWRWSEAKRTLQFLEAVQAHMHASPKPNFNTSVQAVYAETGGKFERVEGYCGLAGEVTR